MNFLKEFVTKQTKIENEYCSNVTLPYVVFYPLYSSLLNIMWLCLCANCAGFIIFSPHEVVVLLTCLHT